MKKFKRFFNGRLFYSLAVGILAVGIAATGAMLLGDNGAEEEDQYLALEESPDQIVYGTTEPAAIPEPTVSASWPDMDTFLPEAVNTWGFTVVGSPVSLIAAYLVIVNLIALLMMWSDKHRSKKDGARRISEKALFLSAILGGSVGAILGMRLFHHKTRHWYFVWGMPLILLLQLVLAVVIWRVYFSL